MNLNPFQSAPEYKNPANEAMPYLDKIPETIKPYYDPYINAGNTSLNSLMQQYQALLSNPGSIMNMAGAGFQQSPGYQFQMDQAMLGGNNAAAAGGMLGTNTHQFNNQSTASGLANQDYYNYLSHALGLYGQGLQGTQGVAQMGYGASNELANSLGNNLMNQGGMAYAGQANQNQANADAYKRNMDAITAGAGFASGLIGAF
jgi:hypothetical protein